MIRLKMKTDKTILSEKLRRNTTNTIKVDQYGQSRLIGQAKFTYSLLGKAFEKQTKIIEDQREKQIEATEDHVKQLVKSNVFAKKESLPFYMKEESIPLDKQNEIFYKQEVLKRKLKIEK